MIMQSYFMELYVNSAWLQVSKDVPKICKDALL